MPASCNSVGIVDTNIFMVFQILDSVSILHSICHKDATCDLDSVQKLLKFSIRIALNRNLYIFRSAELKKGSGKLF